MARVRKLSQIEVNGFAVQFFGSKLMADAKTTGVTAALREAYQRFYIALRVRQAKICFSLAMILVPACIGLDHFVYPKLAWTMFKARLWCDLAMIPCFLALFTIRGQKWVRWLDSAPLLLAAVAICWMIYLAEGALSPYYAGLNIVISAAILLIPYTLPEAIAVCGFVGCAYTAACLLHCYLPPASAVKEGFSPLNTVRTLINNFYFLSMTAVIALTSCYYSSVRRFAEFRLRHELDENNIELASTLKKLQETEVQLVQSEKMNALGKLSAGLLHEINNPLNFTFMALQVAEQDAGENPALKETLADIHQGMTRIRTVISDLRGFAYPSKLSDSEEFSLDDALVTAKRLIAHELGDIAINDSSVQQQKALGTKTQIVHVFMNLLINSVQAMKGKSLGRKPQIVISCVPVGDRVKVAVRDNGTGVQPADLPRLFEPFFTTKSPGEGTGLGLSICHTIIQNHGGTIGVTSEPGQWTEVAFDLALPMPARMAA
jgi:two-component system sensor histidine kinase PhcS